MMNAVTTATAEHASLPREQRRLSRNRPKPWTVGELTAWLRLALSDRFAALWLLAATWGMRRSEPAGAGRELLARRLDEFRRTAGLGKRPGGSFFSRGR
jgi:hypothetical protein